MGRSIRARLALMMFGQYLVMGAWVVTLATYLIYPPTRGGLAFTPAEVSWTYSTLAFAGIAAPLFIGLLADRLFAAEKLLAVTHLLGAGILTAAALWCANCFPAIDEAYREAAGRQLVGGEPVLEVQARLSPDPDFAHSGELRAEVRAALERVNEDPELRRRAAEAFGVLFGVMLAYAFCNLTALTVANVIGFRNLHDAQRSFGGVRLFGTVGWMVAGVLVGLCLNPISPAPLFLSAGLSAAMGLYCFTLPHTPPPGRSSSLREALGLPALGLFRDFSFAVLALCALGTAAVQQFYGIYANKFLTDIGAPYPAAVQTLAQAGEVLCMLLFPLALPALGMKGMMLLGLLGWCLRNGVFATGSVPAVVALGLPLHGLCYSFFFIVMSMYVDRIAPGHLRASAQGIVTFFTLGVGTLAGNWLSAAVVESRTVGQSVAWSEVWLVPTVASGVLALAFALLFRPRAEKEAVLTGSTGSTG